MMMIMIRLVAANFNSIKVIHGNIKITENNEMINEIDEVITIIYLVVVNSFELSRSTK